jgi:hypothetical protein
LAHSDIIGSVLAMCHHRIFLLEPEPPSSSLHPARTVPAEAAAARPSTDLRLNRTESLTVNSPFGAVTGAR